MSDQPAARNAPNPAPTPDEQWINPYTDPEDVGDAVPADALLGRDGRDLGERKAHLRPPGDTLPGGVVRGDVVSYQAVDRDQEERNRRLGTSRRRPSLTLQDWVVPFIVMGIGIALGLIDLVSVTAPGTLRIPALIAALFLFGASLNEVLPVQATKVRLEKRVEAEEDTPPDTGLPKVHQRGVSSQPAPQPQATPGSGSAVFLMALGIILGLAAALTFPSAPAGLTLLSLLAAFLIFYRGLGELPIK